MKVSLCVVAYNEGRMLPDLLIDFTHQTYPHEKIEVVLIDSCSADGTKQIMEQFKIDFEETFYAIQVIDNPGRIQSCGWNIAITHFTTDVIIRVDAHSHIPEDFVQKNIENLMQGELVSGGARPTLTKDKGAWQNTLLMAEESMFGSSVSSFRRKGEKAYVKSFFHGAYRREVFQKVGGFREDLGRTEDNELHYRIRENGYRLCMSPDIISYQFIRPTMKKMCKQKFGNGYWIGLTLGVCPRCLSLYHFVPGAFVLAILCSSILSICGILWPALWMWGTYWLLAIAMSAFAVRGEKKNATQILLPALFFLLHVSYGGGTILGLCQMPFWSRKHKVCDSVERVKRKLAASGISCETRGEHS